MAVSAFSPRKYGVRLFQALCQQLGGHSGSPRSVGSPRGRLCTELSEYGVWPGAHTCGRHSPLFSLHCVPPRRGLTGPCLPARGSAGVGGRSFGPWPGFRRAHRGPQLCLVLLFGCTLISSLLQESKPEQGLAGESHSTGEQPPPLSMATRYRARWLGVAAPFRSRVRAQPGGCCWRSPRTTAWARRTGWRAWGPAALSLVVGRGAMCQVSQRSDGDGRSLRSDCQTQRQADVAGWDQHFGVRPGESRGHTAGGGDRRQRGSRFLPGRRASLRGLPAGT